MPTRKDNTVTASEQYGYGRSAALPEGVEHGSFAAVYRYGCGCEKCQERGRKARDRGWRPIA